MNAPYDRMTSPEEAQVDAIVSSADTGQIGGALSENPFSCNVCKRSYTRVDHLARHYRSRE